MKYESSSHDSLTHLYFQEDNDVSETRQWLKYSLAGEYIEIPGQIKFLNDDEEEDEEVSDDHRMVKREAIDNSSDDATRQLRPMKCSDLPMTVLVAMYPDLGKIASLRRNPT